MNLLQNLKIFVFPALIIAPLWVLVPRSPKQSRLIQNTFKSERYRYTLLLPDGYSGKEAVPLVLVLHYGGHGTPYYGKAILVDLVEPALRDLSAIFVSPDCPAEDWTQPESVQFVLALLDYLQKEYNIDSERILITGYSLGGIGTWHLAEQYPERFSAAIVMAGLPPSTELIMDWQIPLYVIQGSEDELFPVEIMTKFVAKLEESGADVAYRVLDRVTHYESNRYIGPLKETVPWILKYWQK